MHGQTAKLALTLELNPQISALIELMTEPSILNLLN